ncbi:MAG: hypothetical protein JWN03_2804 [Nocardia sp.]|nr:hypothetical protein [Nocardia sp.]
MAQLVAHLTGSEGVRGSNPLSSTILFGYNSWLQPVFSCLKPYSFPFAVDAVSTLIDLRWMGSVLSLLIWTFLLHSGGGAGVGPLSPFADMEIQSAGVVL